MTTRPAIALLVLTVLGSGCSHKVTTSHWAYAGDAGPARWGDLSPDYALCREGQQQSPVDIATTAPVRLTGARKRQALLMHLSQQKQAAREVHNGHTIEVEHLGADTLDILGNRYSLVQYHFHVPSEHTVDGVQFPMELHFVHQAGDGRLAVVGVLFALGEHNQVLEEIRANVPRQKGGEVVLADLQVALGEFLPLLHSPVRYEGSLTTPPCSEGVTWIVFTEPVEVSAEQIATFRSVVHENSRPTQPLNGRPVVAERFERAR